MSKFGVFSGPYFPVFSLIQIRKNSVFGHFSRSAMLHYSITQLLTSEKHQLQIEIGAWGTPYQNYFCKMCPYQLLEREQCVSHEFSITRTYSNLSKIILAITKIYVFSSKSGGERNQSSPPLVVHPEPQTTFEWNLL